MFVAPLRLLAWEQQERMTAAGVATELLTGQETIVPAGATHLAATVEMADVTSRFDVAVIDECQNISDPERGWAWTRYR
jgi:ATP-dependent RNA helicase SUPV3L1/SUV3